MSNRSPLTDPRPGDVVAGRRVEEVTQGGLVVFRQRARKKWGTLHFVGTPTWIAWAKGKEIEYVAP